MPDTACVVRILECDDPLASDGILDSANARRDCEVTAGRIASSPTSQPPCGFTE